MSQFGVWRSSGPCGPNPLEDHRPAVQERHCRDYARTAARASELTPGSDGGLAEGQAMNAMCGSFAAMARLRPISRRHIRSCSAPRDIA